MVLAKTTTNVKDGYLKNDGADDKSWMMKKIMLLIEERRNQKNNSSTYKGTYRRQVNK